MAERPDFQVRGEWDNEPDREEFQHAELPCLILRQPAGHLCGYVGVPPSHPIYGKDYTDLSVTVHGGLTFGEEGTGEQWPEGFCWLGFDCAHGFDYRPPTNSKVASIMREFHGSIGPEQGEVYRNWVYVKAEVRQLAEWLRQQERSDA